MKMVDDKENDEVWLSTDGDTFRSATQATCQDFLGLCHIIEKSKMLN